MTEMHAQKLEALVGFGDEWMARSMESVFEGKGYHVTRVSFGSQALKQARTRRFDVIMLDERLEGLTGVEICIALRDDPLFDHATPIVLVSSAHSTLPGRTAAYAAGAWEWCHQPVDVDGLFLKIKTFLRARKELASAQARTLMDPDSGLYTPFGLQQLAEQLEARAVRKHEAFACLAFSSQSTDDGRHRARGDESHAFADLAHLVREQARKSDIVAQTGDSRLALLAPDTDAAGARQLVARLQRQLDAASRKSDPSTAFGFRAGYCAVSDLAAANLGLNDLVHRAESALAHVATSGKKESVVSFDELPIS